MLLLLLLARGVTSECPSGWIAAPSDAPWTSNKCYASAGNASTLQGCNALCAASGAAPACLESQAEVDFVLANVMCENNTCGLPHWTGHYHGNKCVSGGDLTTFANPSGIGVESHPRSAWPYYSHTQYLMNKESLWYHPDTLKYELLECTLLFDRFHSQYTHELRDTCAHDPKRNWPNSECRGNGQWHPVPCRLECVRTECSRCVSVTHDDWVPDNVSCLCAANQVADEAGNGFMAAYHGRQVVHWKEWADGVAQDILLIWLVLALLPLALFLSWLLCRRLSLLLLGKIVQAPPAQVEDNSSQDEAATPAAPTEETTGAAPAAPGPHGIPAAPHGVPHRMPSLFKRTSSTHRIASLEGKKKAIEEARKTAFSIRVRVSGGLVQIGWTLICLPTIVFVNIGRWAQLDPPHGGHLPLTLCGWPIGLFCLLLALFPIDAMAVRVSCYLVFGIVATVGTMLGLMFIASEDGSVTKRECEGDDSSESGCRVAWIIILCVLSMFAGLLIALAPTLLLPSCSPKYAKPPRAALRRVWQVMRVFLVIFGVPCTFIGTLNTLTAEADSHMAESLFPKWMMLFGFTCLLTSAFSTRRNRGRAHRWLIGLAKRGDHQQEAATIAALVSGSRASDVLAEGAKRFRALRLDAISANDLSSNSDTQMFNRTEPAKLGTVDAFISHSWQDDGNAKHAQLQVWAQKLRATNGGQEPLVWLDKACIDQDNIDANLASLPVFLAGCRSLVVLAGQTYCERLWCVVELFTFLRMGGSPDNIVVYRLGGSDKIREALAKFDGLKAKCYFPRDREKLLAVVEAGYGDMGPFNKQVRHILDKNSEGDQATFQDDDEASGGSGVQPSGGGAPPHGIPERVRV